MLSQLLPSASAVVVKAMSGSDGGILWDLKDYVPIMYLIINTLQWVSKALHWMSRSVETMYWGLEHRQQIRNLPAYRTALEAIGKVEAIYVKEPSISPESGHIWAIWIDVYFAEPRAITDDWAALEERVWAATDHLTNSRSQLTCYWPG